MKKYIFLLFFVLIIRNLSAQTLVEQANEAYLANDYSKAAKLYEQAIQENGQSAVAYYNLGNAYYRLNKTALSLLNYERALLLDPSNKDIRANLAFVQSKKTIDKIEPVDDFFLAEIFNNIRDLYSTNQWSRIAIGCFLVFVGGLFLFFFSRRIVLKKIGFYTGLSFLILCFSANIFAYNQKQKLTHRNTAIIFSPTTTIKSSPDNSGTDLFILHEGTKVTVKNKFGEWNEIETADGNVGWIKSSEIEVI